MCRMDREIEKDLESPSLPHSAFPPPLVVVMSLPTVVPTGGGGGAKEKAPLFLSLSLLGLVSPPPTLLGRGKGEGGMEGVELRPLRRREKRGLRGSGGGEASLCAARARSEAGERGAKDGWGADRGHGARARAAEANGGGGRDGDLADFPHTCARRCRREGGGCEGRGGDHTERRLVVDEGEGGWLALCFFLVLVPHWVGFYAFFRRTIDRGIRRKRWGCKSEPNTRIQQNAV